LGENGIIHGAHSGLIYVDNSTIKPAIARQIAIVLGERGVQCLDAPVSGGDIGARQGTLSIMVGGPANAVEIVRPVFAAIGKTVTHVGDSGAGQIAKAAQKVVEAIKGGAAQCWTLDVKPQRLFSNNRSPGFKAHMQAKDMNIILETARQYGIPLPSAAVDAQLFNAMLEMGMGDLDNSAVLGVIEILANSKLLE
jgi:2-hydroxy-3-oxopropionate reductase